METRYLGMTVLSISIAVLYGSPLCADDPIGVELPEDGAQEAPPPEETPEAPPPMDEAPPGDTPPSDEPPVDEASPGESDFAGVVLPPNSEIEPASPPPPTASSPAPAPAPAPAPPDPAEPSAPEDSFREPQLMEAGPPEEEPTEKEEIFSWFTVSPQVGYLFFPKSEMEFNGMKATVDTRNGLVTKLHFDLGGDDLGFEIAPIYAMEYGGIHPGASGFANLSGLDFSKSAAGASLQAVGGELTIVYRFPVKKFFPHIGAGFRGTYLFGDQIEYGTEIYGRFPIGFTAYLGKHIAFVFEIGFMGGATGVRTPPALPEAFDTMPPELRMGLEEADSQADFAIWYMENQADVDQWIVDNQEELPEGYNRTQMASDFVSEQMARSIRFGSGFGMDVVIGIRFP